MDGLRNWAFHRLLLLFRSYCNYIQSKYSFHSGSHREDGCGGRRGGVRGIILYRVQLNNNPIWQTNSSFANRSIQELFLIRGQNLHYCLVIQIQRSRLFPIAPTLLLLQLHSLLCISICSAHWQALFITANKLLIIPLKNRGCVF